MLELLSEKFKSTETLIESLEDQLLNTSLILSGFEALQKLPVDIDKCSYEGQNNEK